jgi:hypothetical protein
MAKYKFEKDPLGQHIRLYTVITNSPAWCSLSTTAKALWCDMRCQIVGYTNGTATCALGILSHKGWTSRHTVMRARKELETLGFIRQTRAGGISCGGKTPNLYRFTDLEVFDQPSKNISSIKADHLYREFKTKSDATRALKEMRLEDNKNKVLKQSSKSVVAALCERELSVNLIQ